MTAVKNRVALITGAGRGLGRAIAEDLGRSGWSVAVHYWRSADGAREAVRAIEMAGGHAMAFRANLADEEDAESLLGTVMQEMGPVGCLVNSAAVRLPDGALDATRENWEAHMAVNVRAPFVLMQNFARALPGGDEGCIINMIDERVLNLTPHEISYTLSKSALWVLTRTMAGALAPRIRVNGIGPGPVGHEESHGRAADHWKNMPLRRRTTEEDVCDAVRFLVAARGVTGQMLALDAGEHLGWAHPEKLPGLPD